MPMAENTSVPIPEFPEILAAKLLMSLPDIFFLVNSEGRIVCANPPACRFLKTDDWQLKEQSLFDLANDKPEKIKQIMLRWSRSGQPIPATLQLKLSSGETVPCQIWGNMLEQGSDGQPCLMLLRLKSKSESTQGFVTLTSKISQLKKEINDRRLAEQALRHSQEEIATINQELEQRVEHRTKELKQTNQQLSQSLEQLQQTQEQLVESEKMASLGSLVAGVAHEINTPIGVGVTAASFLQTTVEKYHRLFADNALTRNDFSEFMNSAHESTGMILSNLQRASELIQSFKQVAVDQNTDELRDFNLKQYIEEVLISLHPKLKKTAINIKLNGPDDLMINNTPGAIYQIITNLIMNSLIHAFEPSSEGQISITVKDIDKQNIQLLYADNGKGTSAKNVKKIFEPFFSTNRPGGGSGLGMHIVYNLVTRKLGGKITCQSEPGKGIEFDIRFPATHN